MNAGQERQKKKKKKKFPALYENIPQVPTLFIIYTHNSYSFLSTALTIYNANIVDRSA